VPFGYSNQGRLNRVTESFQLTIRHAGPVKISITLSTITPDELLLIIFIVNSNVNNIHRAVTDLRVHEHVSFEFLPGIFSVAGNDEFKMFAIHSVGSNLNGVPFTGFVLSSSFDKGVLFHPKRNADIRGTYDNINISTSFSACRVSCK
jgi:hypothetical protein